ncbi:uncharacterized protein LOC101853091 [Aplysia californica]|uniref:Uncharacterized protein LOC101853091 n=1 Tax=Aplysia californica TaxID=6500 RepID=A0ABM0JR06_APLCA|nr:uncharacterized protein LOC101853091 [Aplysia californica]
MSLKRSWLACRLKTRVAIFALTLIFISMALMYRALLSHDTKPHVRHSSLPTMDKRKFLRFQPKYSELDIPHADSNIDRSFHLKSHRSLVNGNPDAQDLPNLANNIQLLKDRDLLSADSKEALTNFLKQLYPDDWAHAPDTDEIALDLKYVLIDYGFESKMSCKEIDSLRLGNPVSFSSSKFIEYAYDDNQDNNEGNSYENYYNRNNRNRNANAAVKSPSSDSDTKIACMKQVYDPDFCATMGNYKFLREILFMATLHHPSILTMKGYCLRGNRLASKLQEKGLVMVTETGVALTPTAVRSSSWYQRLHMALQVSHLLLYLDSSPFGSLRLRKLELKDLILVKGDTVKLADLDELEVGESLCQDAMQCRLQGRENGGQCLEGSCFGLNALSNLDKAATAALLPMLRNPDSEEATAIVRGLEDLSLSTPQLVVRLQKLLSETSKEEPPLLVVQSDRKLSDGRARPVVSMTQDEDDNSIHPLPRGNRIDTDSLLSRFERHDQSNFAGIYDYPCAGSRVSWGCVHTVRTLHDVADLCLKDDNCRCFVTFTTRPEEENLMTVVLKNATDAYPQSSSGTTLFIRRSAKYDVILRAVEQQNGDLSRDKELDSMNEAMRRNEIGGVGGGGSVREEGGGQELDADDQLMAKSDLEITECIDRTLQIQDAARLSREKRLMAHMGLKGTREQVWRRSVLHQNLGIPSRIVRAAGGGGKFLVNFTKRFESDLPEVAKKATFIAEDGPVAFHIGYALLYHLDRLLGLYHTPPCVGQELSADLVDRLHANSHWEEAFRPLIEADGTLSGILVVPTPKVMKVSKLILSSLEAPVVEIKPFERMEKLQLEYVLLWWLGRVQKRNNEHLGYKGHLIHFYADKAFTNVTTDFSGYLHQCQFPNVAFKALLCFKCVRKNGISAGPEVCALGQEVIRRTHSMFTDESEFSINGLSEDELSALMNEAASSVLRIVDRCIKMFGRESVLY